VALIILVSGFKFQVQDRPPAGLRGLLRRWRYSPARGNQMRVRYKPDRSAHVGGAATACRL